MYVDMADYTITIINTFFLDLNILLSNVVNTAKWTAISIGFQINQSPR